jgi:hypothetical protein
MNHFSEAMEEYLTLEFLNDLEEFDFNHFIYNIGFDLDNEKETVVKPEIELFCMETWDIHEQFDCSICMESYSVMNHVDLNCNHRFCYGCVSEYVQYSLKTHQSLKCALCRTPYTSMEIPDVEHLFAIQTLITK